MVSNICLVVTGTMEWIMTFHSDGNFITDELHHFSEELKPPTSIEMARNCDLKDDENT